MTAIERLIQEIASPLAVKMLEETYDLELAATLSDLDRARLVRVLLRAAVWGNKRAIRTLVRLGERAPLVAALQEELAAEDSSHRARAWEGLVEAWQLMPRLLNPEGKQDLLTRIENLHILLSSELPGFVKVGVAEMRQLMDRLTAGATPESLGIAWVPNPAPEVFDAVRKVLFRVDVPFPVDEIAKLDGGARRMAETMIAMRLEDDDPRVEGALEELGAGWALSAMRDG